ncbi:MAG: hypothetical protein K9I59_04665 [Chlorobium sp.]|uniref:hypothetical protein n=1 Tax=Chlorobium sp. TaxID=1095 RepID=UPI0025B81961|nr:hypothetical protein [Chlorobium sp.]MCF8216104.1 hypothetical protein [Chlorobium sp.]MCF8271005.1 hypothetical protein [Chlorobium sp.]MCF8287349.1 hypothetical protein [Chlorobium sp.]MCF8290918.1 hypothetical protein [Chlorobium sp.]MCF8385013.1 hypothetical protein [Chlorobium sp.]
MINTGGCVFKLSFNRFAIGSDRPDIPGKSLTPVLAHHTSFEAIPQQSLGFSSPKNTDFVSQRFIRSRLSRRGKPEISRISFVLGVATIADTTHNLIENLRICRLHKTPFIVE